MKNGEGRIVREKLPKSAYFCGKAILIEHLGFNVVIK